MPLLLNSIHESLSKSSELLGGVAVIFVEIIYRLGALSLFQIAFEDCTNYCAFSEQMFVVLLNNNCLLFINCAVNELRALFKQLSVSIY